MEYLSARKYLPIKQQETLVSSDDLERIDTTVPTDFEFKEKTAKHSASIVWTVWVPWLLVISLLLSNVYSWAMLNASTIDNTIFSPAKSAIKYKDVVWTAGIEESKSPFQGWPTNENNRLWEELYQFGVNRIPTSQANQLANKTSPIPSDPGYYVVTLDVFHELHCLNMIRKRIFWNSSMPENEQLSMKHMDHCIDSIRQSLMCSSDITPIPYLWDPKYQAVLPMTGVVHTCRDFESIRDWARDRQSFKFNLKTHVDSRLKR